MTNVLYRPHKGIYAESMAEVKEIISYEGFVECIKKQLKHTSHGMVISKDTVTVKPYRYDPRNQWNTHIVKLEGYGTLGFTSNMIGPDTCSYQGYHFGAPYEDATCIDGYLWDLDSGGLGGDGKNYLDSGGDIPCPSCNTESYLKSVAEDLEGGICGNNYNPDVWSRTVEFCKALNEEGTKLALKSIGKVSLLVDDPEDKEGFKIVEVKYD